jgi:outer membrane protein
LTILSLPMTHRSRAFRSLALVSCAACLASPMRAQNAPPQAAPANPPAQVAEPERLLGPGRALELTIDAAYEIALKNNLGLKIEAVNTEVAQYNYRATWGKFDWVVGARLGYTDAEFQPQDVFGGSSQKSQDFAIDFTRPLATTGGTFGAHFDTTDKKTDSSLQVEPQSTTDVISLSYTQPLLRGAWREYATSQQREAEFDSMRQDEHLRQVRQRLLLDVSNAYWDLVAARENLAVADSSLDLAMKQVDQNQKRLDAGVGTEVEVLQAQAEVATREEGRLLVDVNMRRASDALKQLLIPGTDSAMWETSLVPITPLPESPGGDSAPGWESAFAIAIDRRSDLRQQRLAIDTYNVRHERSLSERKPQLDLDLAASSQGFSGSAGDAFSTTAQYDYPTYSAALVFNYALGNTTARNAERAAWSSLRAARLSYDQLESQVVADVRDAVRQVRYQAEAVRAADKSLELARRQLAAEEARYRNDQSTTFQVLQFQQDQTRAMFASKTTRANYAKSVVTLLAAQGLLGETDSP